MQVWVSGALLLACALGLRWEAGASRARPPWWVIGLDILPLLAGTALVAAWTARPLLGALAVAALAVGLGVADRVKRDVLHEPVVFADRAELPELLRHPEFYLPFAGTAVILAGGAALLATVAAVAWAVPPLWTWSPWPGLAASLMILAAVAVPCWPPVLRRFRRAYEGLAPTYDPALDAASWGLLASLIVHATLARAQRPERRLAAPALPTPALPGPAALRPGPVVLVQLESFFDIRRADPAIPRDLLPNYDSAQREAVLRGRLAVPCWGANTLRSEFAALTGLGPAALGLDRFNPYERFARHRTDSLAWRMKAMGRRTVCVHPFDLSFYGRDRVLPLLGFDRLVGPDAFPGRRGFVDDAALAAAVTRLLAEEGPDLFLFVISVGNHGPWLADRGPEDALPLPASLAGGADAAQLRRFLGGLRRTDALFGAVTGALRAGGRGTALFYGDHQPSLPALLPALLPGDTDTDYVLWDAQAAADAAATGTDNRRLPVEGLPALLLEHLAA